MSKKYVIIKADTNDADYVTRKTLLKGNYEEVIKKVCNVIKKDNSWGTSDMKDSDNDPYRWVKSGELTEEEVDLFSDLSPSSEFGIHTIESVEILTVLEEESLL